MFRFKCESSKTEDVGQLTHHMLENLLELRVGVIRPAPDIIIRELVPETLIELLQDLPDRVGVEIDELQKPDKIMADCPVVLPQFSYLLEQWDVLKHRPSLP